MKPVRGIIAAAVIAGLLSCDRATLPAPQHHLTKQEQQKQDVSDSLTPFFELLDLASIQDPVAFVQENSVVSMGMDGSIIYQLQKDGQNLIHATFSMQSGQFYVTARLCGGLVIEGPVTELYVYLDGVKMAALELMQLDGKPLIVLRYPDQTTYALSSLLLNEALIEYLLENVLSTE